MVDDGEQFAKGWWSRQSEWLIGGLIGVAAFALVVLLARLDEGEFGTLVFTSTVAESVGEETDSTATEASTPSSTTLGSPEAPQSTSSSRALEPTTTNASSTTTTPSPPTTLVTTTSLGLGGETAKLASTTDGDTIDVDIVGGGHDTVRLIGINSPEGGECFAAEATQALHAIVVGQTFRMTRDVTERDQFDRLLRYLWLSDGRFVNEDLVRGGYALAREYSPDTLHANRLAAAQTEAQQAGRGIWSPDACGPPSTASIDVVHVEYNAPGNDNENLNGEWVTLDNIGPSPANLTSWVLKDESASHRYTFPSGFVLKPEMKVSIFSGCGTDTATSLYWCSSGAIWNNSGDTVFILDPNGNIVALYDY